MPKAMTVKDLIEALQRMPQDSPIVIHGIEDERDYPFEVAPADFAPFNYTVDPSFGSPFVCIKTHPWSEEG